MPKQSDFAETEEGIASVMRHPAYLSAQLSDRQVKPSALISESAPSVDFAESAQTLNEPDRQDGYLRSKPLKRWQKKVMAAGAALLFVLGAWMTLTNQGSDTQGSDPAPEAQVSESAEAGLE